MKKKFDYKIEKTGNGWLRAEIFTDIEQEQKLLSFSNYIGAESEEAERHRLEQKIKSYRKFYFSVYTMIPFKKNIKLIIGNNLEGFHLLLYYKGKKLQIGQKTTKKKEILEKINLIHLKTKRW